MTTTQGARRRIETSMLRLHDSQYCMSKLTISLKDVVARPLTCDRPVTPLRVALESAAILNIPPCCSVEGALDRPGSGGQETVGVCGGDPPRCARQLHGRRVRERVTNDVPDMAKSSV